MTEDELYALRQRIGMVFQNPDNQLVATIVEEDIAFGPENLGIPPAEIRKRVDDALEIVGMSAFARHSPHQLSGGQQRRTALLRALLCQPVQTLLLDEPFTGMDPELVSHAAAAVVRLAARRDTVLVTHDEHAADLLGWPVVRLETVGK